MNVLGGITANTMQAQVFYDSNNTAYRIDPNGTSQVSTLNADGTLQVGAGGATFNVTNGGDGNFGNSLNVA